MKGRALLFIGKARELSDFMQRAIQAEQYKGITSDFYFYGSASRTGYLKEGGCANFEVLDQEPQIEGMKKVG